VPARLHIEICEQQPLYNDACATPQSQSRSATRRSATWSLMARAWARVVGARRDSRSRRR
jgi:hypothetical protein